MAADTAKVVNLQGQEVNPTGETDPRVRSKLTEALSMVDGETHTGVGIVLVDHMGRVATLHFYTAGFAHQSISGSAILQARLIENYEKNL